MKVTEERDAYEAKQDDDEHRLDDGDGTDWIASWLNLRGEVTITIRKFVHKDRRSYGVEISAPEVGVFAEAHEDRYPQATGLATWQAQAMLNRDDEEEES